VAFKFLHLHTYFVVISEVVDLEDDTLTTFFFAVNVDATHQQRVAAAEDHQQNQTHPVGHPKTHQWCFCNKLDATF